MRMRRQKDKVQLFNTTLTGTLLFEKKFELHNDEGVPLMLTTLINATKNSGEGHSIEGIFRECAQTEEREKLQNQLKKGDYNIQLDDPHIPAGVLKFWLRSLSEPLIPEHLYSHCIKLGKANKQDASSESWGADLQNVFDKMPQLNIKVIAKLVDLIKTVYTLREKNRMTLQNMAIIFSPYILRTPGTDLTVVNQDAPITHNFLIYLVDWSKKYKIASDVICPPDSIEDNTEDSIEGKNVQEDMEYIQQKKTKKKFSI